MEMSGFPSEVINNLARDTTAVSLTLQTKRERECWGIPGIQNSWHHATRSMGSQPCDSCEKEWHDAWMPETSRTWYEMCTTRHHGKMHSTVSRMGRTTSQHCLVAGQSSSVRRVNLSRRSIHPSRNTASRDVESQCLQKFSVTTWKQPSMEPLIYLIDAQVLVILLLLPHNFIPSNLFVSPHVFSLINWFFLTWPTNKEIDEILGRGASTRVGLRRSVNRFDGMISTDQIRYKVRGIYRRLVALFPLTKYNTE